MSTPASVPNGKPDRTAQYQAMAENEMHSVVYNDETDQWERPVPVDETGILPSTTLDQAAAAGA